MPNDCLMLKAAQPLVNPGPGMDGPDSFADDDLEVICPEPYGRRVPHNSTDGVKMSLNIKNEDTCSLAAELAALTGETMTGAITVALQERLEREIRARNIEIRVRELQAIGRSCASLLGDGPSSVEHGDFLYDERGFPR